MSDNDKKSSNLPAIFTARDAKAKTSDELAIVAKTHALDPVLKKHGITSTVIDKFRSVADVSGSMNVYFDNGFVQIATELVITLSHRLLKNENAEVDCIGLGNVAKNIGKITKNRYGSAAALIRSQFENDERGTLYLPAIKMAVGSGDISDVIYISFITDGEDEGNRNDFINYVKSIKNKKVFVQFIGLGSEYDPRTGGTTGEFSTLIQLEKDCDYVGFFSMKNPKTTSEDDVYDKMLYKFATWAKINGIIDIFSGAQSSTPKVSDLRQKYLELG